MDAEKDSEKDSQIENQPEQSLESYLTARQRAVAALSNIFAAGYEFFMAVADMYDARQRDDQAQRPEEEQHA